MSNAAGWDNPETVLHYERFNRRYARYRAANRALIGHSHLAGGMHILDFGAGTGRTAESALPFLGTTGSVLCVEPAAAMRLAGRKRLADVRVRWSSRLPVKPGRFHRILCGASIWQVQPLDALLERFAGLLLPGGAVAFNIPALYLGVGDEAGQGSDPLLLRLPALLAEGCTAADAAPFAPLPSPTGM
ncbi:MAG: class I SAM-dependent methyltransferase, partial [Acidobacteria bacterium]|nr:class I SAM-dependent methyltransferase [Acidobacteriota bacterium]